MPKSLTDALKGVPLAMCALAAMAAPWSQVQAGRAIDERRAADPQGEVEIVNVSGSVQVDGWDRNEVEVGGTAGDGVDRVDLTGAGNRTSIHVVSRNVHSWGADGEARLVIHVPARSAVTVSLVSADFKTTGVQGGLKLQSVSGGVSGDVGGDVHASTVSGDVRLTARSAKRTEVKTISGDIQLAGAGGEVYITTVSGKSVIEAGEVSRGRFKSISGDMTVALALSADGQIDAESVSGDLGFKFAAVPAAEFDVQSFSGDIENCFGPKPAQAQFGPGSRLQFANGSSHAHVQIATKSGDVRLCTQKARAAAAAGDTPEGALSPPVQMRVAQAGRSPLRVPYVF